MNARSRPRGRIQPEQPSRTDAANAEVLALVNRQLDSHHAIDKRVAVLETELKHLATKNDVTKAKLWATTSGFATLVSLALVILAYLRILP